MRLRKFAVVGAVVLSVALMWVPTASAASVTGSFSIAGSFFWENNALPGDTSQPLSSANALDFTNAPATPETSDPGTPGVAIVIAQNGSFSGLLTGSLGTIKDFSYLGGGTPAFPIPPIAAFESFGGGSVTVDFVSITKVVTTCAVGCNTVGNPKLDIDGTILFKVTGFDPTPGSFTFQGNQNGGSFAFAASQAAVPEPTSLILLGLGLTGVVLGRRLKK